MSDATTPASHADERQRRIERAFARLVLAFGAATAALGAFVLIVGWALGVTAARSIAPMLAAMAPSTAFCFVVIGLSILRLTPPGEPLDATGRRIALGSGLIVGLIASINIVVFAITPATGVDALLFPRIPTTPPAYMAEATAMDFLFAAGCLLRLGLGEPRRHRIYATLVTGGLLIALTTVTAYILDPAALDAASAFTGQAAHTAIGFLLVFLAFLFARPDSSWLSILTGSGEGSVGARRLFFAIVIAPVALSFAALLIIRMDFLSVHFRLAVTTVVVSTVLAALVLRGGAIQNDAEKRLLGALKELRETVKARDVLLQEVYHRVKNNLQQMDAIVALEATRLDDARALSAMENIRGRIRALGAVHQMLLTSHDLSMFDIKPFLQTLCANIAKGQSARGADIVIDVEAASEQVTLDFGIPLGLLVNELVTNALKHAFPEERSGRISVKYSPAANGGAILTVEDNGVGLPDGIDDIFTDGGMGGLIISSLTSQLSAELAVNGMKGLRVSVNLPADVKGART